MSLGRMSTIPGSTNSRPANVAIAPAVLRMIVPSATQSMPVTVMNSTVPKSVRSACGWPSVTLT